MKLLLMILLIQLVPIVVHADQYLCITEQSAGITYNKFTMKWESTTFKGGNKYIIRKQDKKDMILSDQTWVIGQYEYVVLPFGKKFTIAECQYGFLRFKRKVIKDEKNGTVVFRGSDTLLCEGGLNYVFKFDKLSGRFTMSYLGSYTVPTYEGNEAADTPFVSIGKCSLIW